MLCSVYVVVLLSSTRQCDDDGDDDIVGEKDDKADGALTKCFNSFFFSTNQQAVGRFTASKMHPRW